MSQIPAYSALQNLTDSVLLFLVDSVLHTWTDSVLIIRDFSVPCNLTDSVLIILAAAKVGLLILQYTNSQHNGFAYNFLFF